MKITKGANILRDGDKKNRDSLSRLLTTDEQNRLDQLIGSNFQNLISTVIQLYVPRPEDGAEWKKLCCGVLCVLKERSFNSDIEERPFLVMRLYCLVRGQILWEQFVPQSDDGCQSWQYTATCPSFHTLSVDGDQIGLNFADEDEAELVLAVINSRRSVGYTDATDYRTPSSSVARRKLSKSDISFPSNFRVVSHVEWNAQSGFTLRNVDRNFFNFFTTHQQALSKEAEPSRAWNRTTSMPCLSHKKKKKLNGSDISLPRDFRHVSHIPRNNGKLQQHIS